MKPIPILLVDDHEDSLDILEFFIKQLPDFDIVAKCKDGEELLDILMKNEVDVVLLDINMPKLNGMEAIERCLKINKNLKFIFITSYDQYAVQAFELSAVDYIVKPIEKTRLYVSLEKIRKQYRENVQKKVLSSTKKIPIKFNGSTYYILLDEIQFVEKTGKKCIIYTSNRNYESYENITLIMNKLPADVFFMCHRSYIVNLTKISQITQKNQTYIAYFTSSDRYAHISKLRIVELQIQLANLLYIPV
jgi:two-component system, LytTR family, response regulator